MSILTNWLQGMGEAVDDLGYGMLELRPGEVRLARKGRMDVEVTIRSVLMSGQLLREVLVPYKPPAANKLAAERDADTSPPEQRA